MLQTLLFVNQPIAKFLIRLFLALWISRQLGVGTVVSTTINALPMPLVIGMGVVFRTLVPPPIQILPALMNTILISALLQLANNVLMTTYAKQQRRAKAIVCRIFQSTQPFVRFRVQTLLVLRKLISNTVVLPIASTPINASRLRLALLPWSAATQIAALPSWRPKRVAHPTRSFVVLTGVPMLLRAKPVGQGGIYRFVLLNSVPCHLQALPVHLSTIHSFAKPSALLVGYLATTATVAKLWRRGTTPPPGNATTSF